MTLDEIIALLNQPGWYIDDDDGICELRAPGFHVAAAEIEQLLDDGLIERSPNGLTLRLTEAGRARATAPTGAESR